MTITASGTTETTIVADSRNIVNAFALTILRTEAYASTPTTFFDSDVLENLSAEAWSEYEIQSEIGSDYTTENLSACQTLVDGLVAPVGDGGLGRVRVTSGVVSKVFKCDTLKRGGQTVREFVEYSEGSISRYLYNQIEPLFDATPDLDYFSTNNHATSSYTRNTACWAASIDLSCVVVASNNGSGWTRQRGGTLITTRHILLARHFPYGIGTQVRFSNAAGTVETRTVIGTSAAGIAGDLWVCTLDAVVTIASPCAIAGLWITQDRVIDGTLTRWYSGGAVIHSDQNGKIYAANLGQTTAKVYSYSVPLTIGGESFSICEKQGVLTHDNYPGAIPAEFTALIHTPISGDSGQPVFVIIGGEPVLIWTWTSPWSGAPAYLHNGAVLNALIAVSDANAGVSTGYTVTVAPSPI